MSDYVYERELLALLSKQYVRECACRQLVLGEHTIVVHERADTLWVKNPRVKEVLDPYDRVFLRARQIRRLKGPDDTYSDDDRNMMSMSLSIMTTSPECKITGALGLGMCEDCRTKMEVAKAMLCRSSGMLTVVADQSNPAVAGCSNTMAPGTVLIRSGESAVCICPAELLCFSVHTSHEGARDGSDRLDVSQV